MVELLVWLWLSLSFWLSELEWALACFSPRTCVISESYRFFVLGYVKCSGASVDDWIWFILLFLFSFSLVLVFFCIPIFPILVFGFQVVELSAEVLYLLVFIVCLY